MKFVKANPCKVISVRALAGRLAYERASAGAALGATTLAAPVEKALGERRSQPREHPRYGEDHCTSAPSPSVTSRHSRRASARSS
jgi:hypothetical protein